MTMNDAKTTPSDDARKNVATDDAPSQEEVAVQKSRPTSDDRLKEKTKKNDAKPLGEVGKDVATGDVLHQADPKADNIRRSDFERRLKEKVTKKSRPSGKVMKEKGGADNASSLNFEGRLKEKVLKNARPSNEVKKEKGTTTTSNSRRCEFECWLKEKMTGDDSSQAEVGGRCAGPPDLDGRAACLASWRASSTESETSVVEDGRDENGDASSALYDGGVDEDLAHLSSQAEVGGRCAPVAGRAACLASWGASSTESEMSVVEDGRDENGDASALYDGGVDEDLAHLSTRLGVQFAVGVVVVDAGADDAECADAECATCQLAEAAGNSEGRLWNSEVRLSARIADLSTYLARRLDRGEVVEAESIPTVRFCGGREVARSAIRHAAWAAAAALAVVAVAIPISIRFSGAGGGTIVNQPVLVNGPALDGACADNPVWRTEFDDAQTCDYVARNRELRCRWRGADGTRAEVGCPRTCGLCGTSEGAGDDDGATSPCEDDPLWHGIKNPEDTCEFVALSARQRCNWTGKTTGPLGAKGGNVPAKSACRRTCTGCDGVDPAAVEPAPLVKPADLPCEDDPGWVHKKTKNTCEWVAGDPTIRCQFFGEGGRDRTRAYNSCVKSCYPECKP